MAAVTGQSRRQVVGPKLPAELDRHFDAFVFFWAAPPFPTGAPTPLACVTQSSVCERLAPTWP
jgi:hypothetical protein